MREDKLTKHKFKNHPKKYLYSEKLYRATNDLFLHQGR